MAGDRAPFLSGGNHSMHPGKGVGNQKPGVSSQEGSGSLGGSHEPDAGPPGAGFYSSEGTNKDYAGPQVAGVSASKKSGGNAKFAEGGKHAMFGHRGSQPAKGGQSAP